MINIGIHKRGEVAPIMRMFRSVFFIASLSIFGLNTAWANERLDLLKAVTAAGASSLSLKMLDQLQPKVALDVYEWILWEQERYKILSEWHQWDDLLDRIEQLPDSLPIQFKNQATQYRVTAYLELGQTDVARKLLRQQLWRPLLDTNTDQQIWRRQIIMSYIKDDRLNDAQVAMLRFDQNFEVDDPDWLILRATVLIRLDDYSSAISVLEGVDSWQALLLRRLAQLKAKKINRADLREDIATDMDQPELGGHELATLMALSVFVAEQMSLVDRVAALEKLFAVGHTSPLMLFQLSPDYLWDSYIEYAQLTANQAEILIGDDAQWLSLADEVAKMTPIKARSLYASLMVNSMDAALVSQAASGYLNSFDESVEAKQNLLEQLFNHSKIFSDARGIPLDIRYQLVDLALSKADINNAIRLMSGLTSYPEGTSRFSWQLRQARVLILGGKYDEGSEIIQTLIEEYEAVNTQNTDRILQVLFDMQIVNLHRQAIEHLNALLRTPIDPRQYREILFWIADSYKAIGEFDKAALLYLQSAMLPGPDTMDPWAQTARFNAAESLRQFGLEEDARRIYNSLLKVTAEPARRALLNQSIQQLWLTPIE